MRQLILMLTLLCLALALTLPHWRAAQPNIPPGTPPPPLTIERVQALGTLVTVRVTVRSESDDYIDGYLGALHLRCQGNGSVWLGPDLMQAAIVKRDDTTHTATVRLPEPAVLAMTLDLSKGGIDAEWKDLWLIAPDAALLADGQRRLLRRAQARLVDGVTAGHRARAQHATETAVHELGRSLGWTLNVQWHDRPGRRSLRGERRPGGLLL